MSDTVDDAAPRRGNDPASRRELPLPAVTIAVDSGEAEQRVTEALAASGENASIRVVTATDELGDEPTLLVGDLMAHYGTKVLADPRHDLLFEPFTADELSLRIRALALRTRRLDEQNAETADLGHIVRSIADAIRVAVLVYDTEDRPSLHNRMTEELLALTGFDPATGLSKHVYSPGRRTPVKRDKNIITETLKGDERGIIYWVGDPEQDEQRAIITEAHRISRPNGEPLGAAVLSYDVTDLANAIEAREDYLTSVSHELRTPLTSIVGYLDLIAETHDVSALGFEREFSVIQHNVEQLTALVNELSIAGGREQNLRIEPTDLKTLVTQSTSALHPQANGKHLDLEVDVPPSSLLALADATRLRQVVDNLMSNAVKYTPDGGHIRVRLARVDDDAVITVRNTGAGLSRSDQARVFDRFFRSHEARDAAVRGVGIGLTLAKSLVEAHGGTIAVESTLGEETTFTVTLPLRPEGAPLADHSDNL